MAPAAPPATTVILVREADGQLETYLMRRARSMAFAPGMVVFPGGRVDGADFAAEVLPPSFPIADESRRASADHALTRALWACAVREVREETTVELASPAVNLDQMVLMSHWVTPEIESHRYDVRFFLAAMPSGQEARNVTSEADEALWLDARTALAECAAGRLPMLPPTRAALGFIAEHPTIDAALEAGRRAEIAPLLPRPVLRDDDVAWELVDANTGRTLLSLGDPPTPSETGGIRG